MQTKTYDQETVKKFNRFKLYRAKQFYFLDAVFEGGNES